MSPRRTDALSWRRGGPVARRPGASVTRRQADAEARRRLASGGLTLVELLVATTLASGLLAAAWGWAWTTAAAARQTDAAAQAITAQAFAARMLRTDLAACAGLCSPSLGACGPTRLALLCRDPLSGTEKVVVVAWDPSRHVMWRNASGSYLAEGVSAFLVRYFAAGGTELLPVDGVLGRDEREAARRVVVTWTTDIGDSGDVRDVRIEEDLP